MPCRTKINAQQPLLHPPTQYGAYADYLLANGKIGRTLYSYVSLVRASPPRGGWWVRCDLLVATGTCRCLPPAHLPPPPPLPTPQINPLCRWSLGVCDQFKWQWECLLAVNFCQAVTFVPLMAGA